MIKKTRNNKWQVRVSYKDLEDKYRTKTKTFNTKSEGLAWEREILNQIDDGSFFNQFNTTTFAGYFEDWCRTYRMKNIGRTTHERYEQNIKLVHQFFKKKKLTDVTRKDYQTFLDMRGEGNGKATVEYTHGAIKSCMADALHDGLIDRDPTWRAVINYDNPPTNKLKYWHADELETLINYFSKLNHQRDMIFYLMATTGMRIGEVYGLAWGDIDDNTISIKRGYDNGNHTFTKGKNVSSLRTIQIDRQTVSLLNQYKLKYQRACPDYLFLNSEKKPATSYGASLKHLKNICKQLGVSVLTPHAFRHSHCCYLLYKGVNIQYISSRLGHATTNETQRTYSHVIKELDHQETEKTLKAMDSLLNKNT